MKILHIISGLKTGGAERMLVKLVQNSHTKVEHHVISLLDEGTQGIFIKELGVPVHTINMKSSIPTLKNIFKLRYLIKYIQPDVIQGWMYHGNLAASVRGFAIPVVFNIRRSIANIEKEKKTTQWVLFLNAKLSKKTAKVIYNSNVSRKEHEEYGFAKDKSFFLANGFDVNLFNINLEKRKEIRSKYNIAAGSKLFCQIGRNHQMKNHIGFVKAGIDILREHSNSHFMLVGNGVDNDDEIKKIIKSNHFEDRFVLLGEQNDIHSIWNAADIAVSSSFSEGFPNVIGEAMACGKPCVVTDVGDSGYVIGETGIVVEPHNPKLLKDAMESMLLKSDTELDILGKKARQRIVDKFSIDKVSEQYVNLYKKIII